MDNGLKARTPIEIREYPMVKRLTVSLKQKHAMQVTRVSIGRKKLVYMILAKKAMKYPWDRSRVVYIGTTKKGVNSGDALPIWGSGDGLEIDYL
ncbi:MAG: hypothetical protein ACYTEK_12370 [Planctomycetota bacterium]